ncbi:MAG: DNA photolyase [Spirochaetes bacterium]|nr:DNA photolyase [Spirochaetota bacterium]
MGIYVTMRMDENENSAFVKSIKTNRRFIRPCPGTPQHVCCGYQIIDFARGCDIGCSYCILSTYFGSEAPAFYGEWERLFAQLDEFLEKSRGLVRFGTGEFTDSLLFEKSYPLYNRLIPYFSRRTDSVIEIKTKTTNIESLLEIEDHDNTITAWSLNSKYIAETEEGRAAPIHRRIEAARAAQDAGYRLAFHFDPIILYEGWENGYRETIDMLFRSVDPKNIVYVSMGTLRFPPKMKASIRKLASGEFIRGKDGKLRYFRPLRTRAYNTIKSYLSEAVDDSRLYLCMESPTVWEDVFGTVMTSHGLRKRLDRACFSKFSRLEEKKGLR